MNEKLALAAERVPGTQPAMLRDSLSLYLHIPFCQVRCAYCDFNTYAGLDNLMPAYAQALAQEIRQVGQRAGRPQAHTIFIGGGTPSLLPLNQHAEIFAALRESFKLTLDCEITLEANPGTVDATYLAGLRALGANRLSFGVQSSHAWELKLLDRLHTFEDVVTAVRMAKAAGFDRSSRGLSLDLIFALPQQTLPQWQESVHRALELEPEHLSLYALTLEHGTPLRSWVQRGLLPLPDPDLAAEMYEFASETLEARGFRQYEISNWALEIGDWRFAQSPISNFDSQAPAFACRHNLQYWRNLPYIGFGAGAHGSAGGWRYSNVLSPAAYIARMTDGAMKDFPFSPATVERIPVERATAMGETMMMGMRLVEEGVREAEFEARFDTSLEAAYGRTLRHLRALSLIEWDETGTRLTRRAAAGEPSV